jgi:hypothetical protein
MCVGFRRFVNCLIERKCSLQLRNTVPVNVTFSISSNHYEQPDFNLQKRATRRID